MHSKMACITLVIQANWLQFGLWQLSWSLIGSKKWFVADIIGMLRTSVHFVWFCKLCKQRLSWDIWIILMPSNTNIAWGIHIEAPLNIRSHASIPSKRTLTHIDTWPPNLFSVQWRQGFLSQWSFICIDGKTDFLYKWVQNVGLTEVSKSCSKQLVSCVAWREIETYLQAREKCADFSWPLY